MKLKRAKKIVEIWNRIETSESDISTERLMHMTAQEAGCDDAVACDALILADPGWGEKTPDASGASSTTAEGKPGGERAESL